MACGSATSNLRSHDDCPAAASSASETELKILVVETELSRTCCWASPPVPLVPLVPPLLSMCMYRPLSANSSGDPVATPVHAPNDLNRTSWETSGGTPAAGISLESGWFIPIRSQIVATIAALRVALRRATKLSG